MVGKDGKITARLEGSFGLDAVRAGAQDRAVTRRVAARGPGRRRGGRRRRAGAAGRAGARDRPAHDPADPGVAVRAGPRRSCSWSRSSALAVLWPSPRLQEPPWRPLPGGLGRVLGSQVVEVALRRDRRRAVRDRDLRRLRGRRLGARQPRADVHPDRLLGRPGVRQRAVRRRVPRVQPVARDPAAGHPAVPRALGPLPRRARAARLHVGRAGLRLGRGAGRPDHRRGRLHRLHARDAGGLRDRGVDRATARPSPSTSTSSRACRCGRRATASSACGRRSAGCRGWTRCRARSLFVVGDDRHGHVRRVQPGRSSGTTSRSTSPTRSTGSSGSTPRRRSSPRSGCCSASRSSARFYRLGIDGARSVGGDIDAARAAAGLRPHARADRDGLRRRALPDVPAVRGPGDVLPRVRPARARLGPVRHRVARDRLHVPEPERDVVPAGRRSSSSATSRR